MQFLDGPSSISRFWSFVFFFVVRKCLMRRKIVSHIVFTRFFYCEGVHFLTCLLLIYFQFNMIKYFKIRLFYLFNILPEPIDRVEFIFRGGENEGICPSSPLFIVVCWLIASYNSTS